VSRSPQPPDAPRAPEPPGSSRPRAALDVAQYWHPRPPSPAEMRAHQRATEEASGGARTRGLWVADSGDHADVPRFVAFWWVEGHAAPRGACIHYDDGAFYSAGDLLAIIGEARWMRWLDGPVPWEVG
jgi:hypothetical protein